MNKDALLATLIGLGMGLLITGVIIVGPNILKLIPKFSFPKFSLPVSKPTDITPTPTPATFSFTIISPIAESVVNNNDLLVSGNSYPDARVVVQSAIDEDVVLTDAQGNYAGKVTLSEGKNDIIVTSYAGTTIENKTVTVFYIP